MVKKLLYLYFAQKMLRKNAIYRKVILRIRTFNLILSFSLVIICYYIFIFNIHKSYVPLKF